jgi:GntR family transcriptional regulator
MLRTAPASPLPGGQAPLYARLRQALHDRVTSGEWRPGDQIPTIRELGELYGVSRITVVQALDELSHEGLLVRWQGKGVFVSQPRPAVPRMLLQSFTEETLGRGHIPSSRTLRFVHEAADLRVSNRLGLRVDEGVVLLERLRLMDGYPIAIQRAYLPEQLVPGLLERRESIESLYEVLAETYGILPTNAFESYEPIRLAPEQARLLHTRADAAAFHVDRTTSDQHGRTIEFASSVLRGDRYAVRLNLRRQVTEQLAEYRAI